MLVPNRSKSPVGTILCYVSNKMDYSKIRATKTGRLQCPRCKIRSYPNRKNLFHHWRYECGLEAGFTNYENTKIVERDFNIQSHLTKAQHKKRRFSCTLCTKTFTRKTHLKTHRSNMHYMEWRFSCTVCKKIFKLNSHLVRHLGNVHHDERRFPCCTICPKSFKHLRRHLKTIHHPLRVLN